MKGLESVSRETLAKLQVYADILIKWNPKINLVAKSTISDLWDRHIVDSLQIMRHIPESAQHIVDIGSGGGFPGLVLAIASAEAHPESLITMIESDQRKSAFLRTVLRETGVSATVLTERIEKAPAQSADVLTARALADLSMLLEFAEQHLKKEGTAFFLKGKNWRIELQKAQEVWQFDYEEVTSETNVEAVLLVIKGIERV